jgi:hypothetical protein
MDSPLPRVVRNRSGTRRLGDGERISVGVLEVGDLGSALERGDAFIIRDDRSLVVVLERDARRDELVDNPLGITSTYQPSRVAVDLPALSGER